MSPAEKLRYHVTGAIERGESVAIVEQVEAPSTKTIMLTVTLQTEIEVPVDYDPMADIDDHPFDRRSPNQEDYNNWEVVNQRWEEMQK